MNEAHECRYVIDVKPSSPTLFGRACDERKLSTREAERLTGVAHTEFSRIRNVKLDRFILDRMISILGKLDPDVEVKLSFRAQERRGAGPALKVA